MNSNNYRMASNFRMANICEPSIYNAGGNSIQNPNPVGAIPPSLPPRPYQTQRFGGLGNSYGGFGQSSYGNIGYGGYNSAYGYGHGYGAPYGAGYNGMYGGFNRMGLNGMYGPSNLESRFIQYAEESSRPAFQSIESIVGAFGGIASMLDSTFMAMTTSFRAILGVAENFGRLRSLFAQFWSTFAIFRTINWLYRKLLSMLGLSKFDPKKAQAWAEALQDNQNGHTNNKTSAWPVLMFLGLITSAPYIIFKLFGSLNSSILEKAADPTRWNNPLLASALYDFQNSNQNEISLRMMQSVKIAPLEIQNQMNLVNSGWLLASTDNKTSGLVPANYIRVIKGRNMADEPTATATISDNSEKQPVSEILDNSFNNINIENVSNK